MLLHSPEFASELWWPSHTNLITSSTFFFIDERTRDHTVRWAGLSTPSTLEIWQCKIACFMSVQFYFISGQYNYDFTNKKNHKSGQLLHIEPFFHLCFHFLYFFVSLRFLFSSSSKTAFERISKFLSNLKHAVLSPQELGGPEPSAEPSEGDSGRGCVAHRPPLAHPLRPAPFSALHQLCLHLSAPPW